MRDGNRLKEKIELRLDQRQVASFAVIALLLTGAVFALGVLVGTRLAAMPAGPPPRPENLLDRLDESAKAGLADAGSDGLTFQEDPTRPREPLQRWVDKKSVKPVLLAQKPKAALTDAGGAAPLPPVPAPVAAAPVSGPFFTVQVKATQSQPEADCFAQKLATQGYHPFVADVELSGKGRWFRVRVGRFDTRAKAERYLADFERETHLAAFVTAGH